MTTEPTELARYIDHTLLKADATDAAVAALCREAIDHGFIAVCVNGAKVPLAVRLTQGSPVRVCSVVGFPLGAMQSAAKAFETRLAIAQGAREIDMVIDLGALKSGRWQDVQDDIRAVQDACGDVPLKVILETGLLSRDEILQACGVCREQGVAFVKTSTGFGPGGATREHVALMRGAVGADIGVKASGGIRDRAAALAMIAAGANRLGTSSGIAIVTAAAAGTASSY